MKVNQKTKLTAQKKDQTIFMFLDYKVYWCDSALYILLLGHPIARHYLWPSA